MHRRDLLRLAAAAGMAGAGIALPGRHAAASAVELRVQPTRITIDGDAFPALSVDGTVPGPTLRWREGEEVTVHVTNALAEPTSIHWHGLLLAGVMDGSPGFNGFLAIPPGQTYTYRFALRQAGTYWYHSHSGGQEQAGLYGAIVITPAGGERVPTDADHVVLLSDHTAQGADTILRLLKANPETYVRAPRTVADFFRDAARDGLGPTLADRAAWADMRMTPTDLADVTGYRFLMNGKGPDDNWTALYRPSQRLRLRFINGSAMTFFDVRIPDLKMTVIAADGQDVVPVPVDEFRIGIGETYDVIVSPRADRAYTIMAEPIDRSGYARGTLAPRAGMTAAVPPPRPRAILSMADMGAAHGMNHDTPAGGGMDHGAMDHGAHGTTPAPATGGPLVGWSQAGTPPGQKALRYEDLKSLTPHPANPPAREIRIALDGQMNRYNWTLNGKRFDQASPIRLGFGERVRITYVNTTMMAHPMHLHGMFVQLENGQTTRMPRKHVVIVKPGAEASVVLTAEEPGEWPFHCHLLYHMNAGMMTRLAVDAPRAAG